ncbi:uncharacterized protein LOC134825130 [Bolinopsis microptera]|uniref:uncharacterized protein LOC134825130 n=1 Tax=Bolinopsis microptera TaxID=2820187 RepID=UPI00307A2DE1
MSVVWDIFLGFFFQNWVYLIIGAVVILTIMGGAGVVWFVYCSDRAKSYKVRPLPPQKRSGRAERVTEIEEVAPLPAPEDAFALPPPVPELLRSMRRERSRQELGADVTLPPIRMTSSKSQHEELIGPGQLVEEEGTISRATTTIKNRATTLDQLRSKSELDKQMNRSMSVEQRNRAVRMDQQNRAVSVEQQNRPTQLRLEQQLSATPRDIVPSLDPDTSSEEEEDSVSSSAKKGAITKRLSAPWISPEQETPTIPFRSCDSFVFNQSPATYRQAHRSGIEEEQLSSPPPRDVITKPRDVITPAPVSAKTPRTSFAYQADRRPSRDAIKAPRNSSRDIVKPERSLSIDVIKTSREDLGKSRTTLHRSETHGAIQTKSESRTLPRNAAPPDFLANLRDVIAAPRDVMAAPRDVNRRPSEVISRPRDVTKRARDVNTAPSQRNRASRDDNRFSTQLSMGEISPKQQNGPLFPTLEEQHDMIHRPRDAYVDQSDSPEMRMYENNRDTVRKHQNNDMDTYAEGFSLPKYTTVNKFRDNSQPTSPVPRDVMTTPRHVMTTPRDVMTSDVLAPSRDLKRSNTVAAPWAHETEQIEYSRECNLDYSSENVNYTAGNMDQFVVDQFGSLDRRYEDLSQSEDDSEFMEPTIYENQEAGFHRGDL